MLISADTSKDTFNSTAKTDFEFLATTGNYGFYRRAEVTTIYIYGTGVPLTNLYTVVVFEEADLPLNAVIKENERYSIGDNLRIGIQVEYYVIDRIKQKFSELIDNTEWKDYSHENSLGIGSVLKVLPKKFIPKDGTLSVPINKALKNNFYTGSYIIEFFDEKKEFVKSIYESQELLLKVDEFIKSRDLPIDLAYLRDRLGNIIFQFPSNLLSFNETGNKTRDGINLEVAWHPLLQETPNCIALSFSELDKEVVGFGYERFDDIKNTNLIMGNHENMKKTIFINPNNNIIFAAQETIFAKHISMDMRTSSSFSEPRSVIYPSGRNKSIKLLTKSRNENIIKDYSGFMQERAFDENRQNFKQFRNAHDEAITYIQKLIQEYDNDGVYLWDPFLSAEDLLNTLFHSNGNNVLLKAICSNDAWKNTSYQMWHEQQSNILNASGNLIGLNLEFRARRNVSEWDFHDRFLIFPRKKRPIVYSLGSSINHIGEKHTIIVQVEHAALIQRSFEKLWDLLQDDDCLIWSSK